MVNIEYQLKGKNNLFDVISVIAENRSLNEEDMKWMLNPTLHEENRKLLRNLEGGVNSLLSHIENNNRIHVLVDGDL
jgi:hypothetical protein